jgi:rubrerythrin
MHEILGDPNSRRAFFRTGGGPPPAPTRASESTLLRPLIKVKTQRDVLEYAIELETMAVGAYYDAHLKLRSAKLLSTGTQIMANEGQHLVVLRTALGRRPVPNAFENGKASR